MGHHTPGRAGWGNANTPNRLKHRALLKLEPRTRIGKGRARTSQRTSTKHEGKRTALTLLALPLQCASEIPIRETSQTLHQKTAKATLPTGQHMGNTMLHKNPNDLQTRKSPSSRARLPTKTRARHCLGLPHFPGLRKISFLAFPLMKCEQVLNKMKTDRTDRTDTAV